MKDHNIFKNDRFRGPKSTGPFVKDSANAFIRHAYSLYLSCICCKSRCQCSNTIAVVIEICNILFENNGEQDVYAKHKCPRYVI